VRLLFDEQLSEALVVAVADLFPDSLHVRILGKGGAADHDVWGLAREHECVLVTKDEDFHRLSVLRGAPPKVVWLRVGNCSTKDMADLLRHHADDLSRFEAQHEATFLELGKVRTD
jgi:predicted nuclease of predicted toxin-antitoxin system